MLQHPASISTVFAEINLYAVNSLISNGCCDFLLSCGKRHVNIVFAFLLGKTSLIFFKSLGYQGQNIYYILII
jgi:hypothetical protein